MLSFIDNLFKKNEPVKKPNKTGNVRNIESSKKPKIQSKKSSSTSPKVAHTIKPHNTEEKIFADSEKKEPEVPSFIKEKVVEEDNSDDLFSVPALGTSNYMVQESNSRVPTQEEMEILNDFTGEVLTASAIRVTKNSKIHCAYLSNRWFVIDKTNRNNPYIASVRQELKRSNRYIDRELLVPLPVIRELYENHERLHANHQSVRRLDMINGQEAQEFQIAFLGLIEDAFKENVSDVHIFVRQHETDLAFRINSELNRFAHRPASWGHNLCQAAFAMAGEADPQYIKTAYQGARISNIDMPNLPKGVQSIRLQFSPLPGGGRYLVCRILKEGSKNTQGISDLGYQKVHVDTINKMRRQSEGITVIAGPTGSGKSTTLVVMISSDMRDNPGKNIITVEDPPEYIILGAAQFAVTNVKNEEEKSEAFGMALGSALRSDPDTVMIGEIRDRSSAGLAFKAALTGHRVYASLHANHAVAIMNRLRDIGVDMYNLTEPSLVAGLIGQRLMRNICSHCRIPLKDATQEQMLKNGLYDIELINKIKEIDEAAQNSDTYEGIFLTNHGGCQHCRKGIAGRATVAETIAPDEDFMTPIREDRTQEAIDIWLNNHKGLTMQEHAIQKMTKGVASPQDVLDVSGDFTKFNVKGRGEKVFGELYQNAK